MIFIVANVTPYTIRKTSHGLIHRVHRDDSNIKESVIEHAKNLENFKSSKNTNVSVQFDLSTLINATKNITKAHKTM